jgi:Cleft lip and palate transmembrane protein 1 (CLPTM1)
LTLTLVSDAASLQFNTLPPPVAERKYLNVHRKHCIILILLHTDIHLLPGRRDHTGTNGFYMPVIFPNEFWHLRSQYIEVNSTMPSLPLRIVFQPISYFKFQLFASMNFGFQEAAKQQGGNGAEFDEVKRMLVETNPWFLGLTGIVSILHVVYVVVLICLRNELPI